VGKQKLLDVLQGVPFTGEQSVVADRLDSPVTSMRVIECAERQYLAAGDEDGVIRIWSVE
jgi:hypothetical protein